MTNSVDAASVVVAVYPGRLVIEVMYAVCAGKVLVRIWVDAGKKVLSVRASILVVIV